MPENMPIVDTSHRLLREIPKEKLEIMQNSAEARIRTRPDLYSSLGGTIETTLWPNNYANKPDDCVIMSNLSRCDYDNDPFQIGRGTTDVFNIDSGESRSLYMHQGRGSRSPYKGDSLKSDDTKIYLTICRSQDRTGETLPSVTINFDLATGELSTGVFRNPLSQLKGLLNTTEKSLESLKQIAKDDKLLTEQERLSIITANSTTIKPESASHAEFASAVEHLSINLMNVRYGV